MWSGPWIPALPSFKVRPKYDNVDFNEHPLVADLIAGNERNLDLLIELFAANPVDNIMKFSVENPNCQDRLFGSKQRPGVIPLKVTIVRIRALDLVKAKRNSGKKKTLEFQIAWETQTPFYREWRQAPSLGHSLLIGGCPSCETKSDGPSHLFGNYPLVRIPWRESEWDVTRCSPPRWDGDLLSLIDFMLCTYTSFQSNFDALNSILYDVVLFSLLWKEKNKVLHENVMADLSCFRFW